MTKYKVEWTKAGTYKTYCTSYVEADNREQAEERALDSEPAIVNTHTTIDDYWADYIDEV